MPEFGNHQAPAARPIRCRLSLCGRPDLCRCPEEGVDVAPRQPMRGREGVRVGARHPLLRDPPCADALGQRIRRPDTAHHARLPGQARQIPNAVDGFNAGAVRADELLHAKHL